MGGKRQQQSPNRYNRSSTGGFDPRGPGVPSSGSPITIRGTPNRSGVPSSDYPRTFRGTPNSGFAPDDTGAAPAYRGAVQQQALRPYQDGMNRPTGGQYNLDPRQAAQFAALPAATQERYYQGGMNRPTGMAAPPSLPPIAGRTPQAIQAATQQEAALRERVYGGGLPSTVRNKVPRNRTPPGVMGSQQLAAGLSSY